MTTTYGYIRTSRQRIQGTAGSDPEAQAHQLRQEGVPEANIYRDVGVSGGTGTQERWGWRRLNGRLAGGDTLVSWPSTVSAGAGRRPSGRSANCGTGGENQVLGRR